MNHPPGAREQGVRGRGRAPARKQRSRPGSRRMSRVHTRAAWGRGLEKDKGACASPARNLPAPCDLPRPAMLCRHKLPLTGDYMSPEVGTFASGSAAFN